LDHPSLFKWLTERLQKNIMRQNPRRALLHTARITRYFLLTVILTVAVGSFITAAAQGSAVVTNGRFTNIYVYPDPSSETWEEHMAGQRPDWKKFTRAAIDAFTDTLMSASSPSYFDSLYQYSGIHPPRFYGSAVASQSCVDAAMRDLNNRVMQWDTIRSLANCHTSGNDPSPQVTLIFSPDIKIGNITPVGTSSDMCANSNLKAWHAWGLNVPNFIALPTDPRCTKDPKSATDPKNAFPDFNYLTLNFSHEIVETLSDPGGTGVGDVGQNEIGDNCQGQPITWSGYTVQKYFSKSDNACVPQVDISRAAAPGIYWLDVSGNPLMRFKGDADKHDLNKTVDPKNIGRTVNSLQLIISTGNDELRGGSHANDNCDVTIVLKDGRTIPLSNVNHGQTWDKWSIHSIDIPLPADGLNGGDVVGVKLHTEFGGGIDGDNWNVQRVQLKATLGSAYVSRVPKSGPTLPNTTITVTVTRVGTVRALGPRRLGGGAIYPMIRIQDGEFAKSPSSRSLLEFGEVPIQIEVWQDLPDYKGSGSSNNPNDPGGRGVHNAKTTLRSLNVVYNLKTHTFTATGETATASRGNAGVEFVFPGDLSHPDVAFTITDHP